MNKTFEKVELLHHYTSIDALCGGLVTSNGVLFRLSHYAFLNDKLEFNLGRELFSKYLDRECQSCIQNIENEPQYILSLSREADFLPMWSMYGRNGNGVMLSLSTEDFFKVSGSIVADCMYCNSKLNFDKSEDEEYVKQNIEVCNSIIKKEYFKQEALNHIRRKLIDLVPLIKSNYFAYEREVRLAVVANNPQSVKYRYSGALIIPYITILLPKSSLRKIMIGPTLDMTRIKYSLRMFLNDMGYENVKLETSNAPYRG